MGTASTVKVLKNNAGTLTEETVLITSAGVADAQKVVALNASGLIDDTIMNASAGVLANAVVKQTGAGIIAPAILNAKNTSAGAGDAAKIPQLNASGILDDTIINATVTSAANKVVKLDGTGKLDSTVMPTGIGADTAAVLTSEILAAGDLVNIYNNAGVANCRKADGSVSGKEAMGFVLAGFASGATATVYFEGTNTQCTGLTPGAQFLSGTTAGKSAAAAATGTGKVVQRVGYAISATALNFDASDPIVLA